MSKATKPEEKTNPLEQRMKEVQNKEAGGDAPKKEQPAPQPPIDEAPVNPLESANTGTAPQPAIDEKPEEKPEDQAAPERPPYELSPEQQTPEQRAYVAAHEEYVDTFNSIPDSDWDTATIIAKLNDHAKKAAENKKEATKVVASDARYVVAEKNGEKKRFKRITWDLLKNSRDGWKEIPVIPAEVQALQNKKEGK